MQAYRTSKRAADNNRHYDLLAEEEGRTGRIPRKSSWMLIGNSTKAFSLKMIAA
jgi:hypothetical protein